MGGIKIDIYEQSFFNYLESLGHSSECDIKDGLECNCHYQISIDMHEHLKDKARGDGVESIKDFERKHPWILNFKY